MEGSYSAAIRDALFAQETEESVERVKDVVSDVLRRADPQVEVFRTNHFNHTFSPDLVLEWPKASRSERRRVFLRATQRPEIVSEDIDLIGDQQPIFIHLDELDGVGDDSKEGQDRQARVTSELREKASETRTLVTEIDALQEIGESRTVSAGAGLFSTSLVRGGMGLLERELADTLVETVDLGFLGAQTVDLETTAATVEAFETYLDAEEASRLTSVLQAVWVGSGGHSYDFPSVDPKLVPNLDTDSLRFLLTTEELDDDEFWSRLGQTVTLPGLSALGSLDETPSMQKLMAAALPRLRCKSCYVRTGQERLDSKDADFKWSVDRSALSLRGHGVQVWVANRLDDVEMSTSDSSLPSVRRVAGRAAAASIEIFDFEAESETNSLRFGSADQADVIGTAEAFVTAALGEGAALKRVSTVLATGHHFDVNFASQSGSARTRAQATVSDVVWTSANLLSDMSSPVRRSLEQHLELTPFAVEESPAAVAPDEAGTPAEGADAEEPRALIERHTDAE